MTYCEDHIWEMAFSLLEALEENHRLISTVSPLDPEPGSWEHAHLALPELHIVSTRLIRAKSYPYVMVESS